jgi:hypothetical protein
VIGYVQVQREFLLDETLSNDAKIVGLIYASLANFTDPEKIRQAWPGKTLLLRLARMNWHRICSARQELIAWGALVYLQDGSSGKFGSSAFFVKEKLLPDPSDRSAEKRHCGTVVPVSRSAQNRHTEVDRVLEVDCTKPEVQLERGPAEAEIAYAKPAPAGFLDEVYEAVYGKNKRRER